MRSSLVPAVIGLSGFYWSRGEHRTAFDLAEQALALAEQAGATLLSAQAHALLGISLHHLGEPTRALEHLEQVIHFHDPSEHRFLAVPQARLVQSYAARTLWILGHPDRARRMSREAVDLAREGDPYFLGLALFLAATVHLMLRERDRAQEQAKEAIAIGRERGFPAVLAMGTVCRGSALGGSRGLEELNQVATQFVAARTETAVGYVHYLLAEANREAGRTEEALAALEPAFSAASETQIWDADLQRVKGEIFMQQESADEAERCFRLALEIARKQEAKSFELRAANSLARLLRDQGRRDEARDLLQPVYDWFTEGFDTVDLKDAKVLLDELNWLRCS